MKKKWDIGWGVETRCNMNCEFCYSKDVREFNNKLEFNTYKKFIDNNHDSIGSINYGTGENSLSEDWFKLVEYIGTNYPFIKQALTTNGHISLACKNKIKKKIFVDYIDEVDISLDFYNKARHNQFRGNKDAYDMALSAFNMCNEYCKQTTLVFLGTNEVADINNLEGLFHVAHRHNAFLRTNIYRPTQGINKDTQKFILDFEKLIEMLQWISDKHKIIKISDRLIAAMLFKEKSEDYSGYSSLRILGDGSITPSTYLISEEYRKYSILKNTHLDNISFDTQIQRGCIPPDCNDCTIRDICKGGAYDRRLLWYSTLNERDPYCPKRYNYNISNDIRLSVDSHFKSIHDSYLPTMFFSY